MKRLLYPGCTFKTAVGYAPSFAILAETLDLELFELPDWNCCGATAYPSLNELPSLALGGRNLALAEDMGAEEIFTPCNACLATLGKDRERLLGDEETREKVNLALLEEGLQVTRPPPGQTPTSALHRRKALDPYKRVPKKTP
ncbi:heterodisulfide reductase-related iron-sulfur binding cluster [Thermosulfuriphilus sp.]